MLVSKVKDIIIERRLPWFIKAHLDNTKNRYHYYKNRLLWRKTLRSNQASSKTIVFKCGYHGKSGAVFSIADTANLLVHQGFQVEFVSYPDSNYNPLLESAVKIVTTPKMDADIFICDVSCEHEFFEALKKLNQKLIVTCHGKYHGGHGLDPEYVRKSLLIANKVCFVSAVQQESFQLQEGHYEIIPNMTKPIKKTQRTNNAGVVGNLHNEQKNAKEALEIASDSKADYIHLWGSESVLGIEQSTNEHSNVKIHGWEHNKEKIYNSFDVLVFMSKDENCPMVVIESLSAGIPCLLSAIPAHEQFRECPGVEIIDSSNRKDAPQILNKLLEKKDELREPIINFWKENYSERVISQKWIQMISDI